MIYIINEDQNYFLRRNINFRKSLFEIIEKVNPCKYKKLTTYLDVLIGRLIMSIGSVELINDERFTKEIINTIEDYVDMIVLYYSRKCGREIKV
jgi:diacylglycerol kinase